MNNRITPQQERKIRNFVALKCKKKIQTNEPTNSTLPLLLSSNYVNKVLFPFFGDMINAQVKKAVHGVVPMTPRLQIQKQQIK